MAKTKKRLTMGDRLIREALTSQGRPLPGTPEDKAWLRGRAFGEKYVLEKVVEKEGKQSSERVTFSGVGSSNLSGLLALAQSMPRIRYDPASIGFVGDFDAKGKTALLQGFDNATDGLARAVQQIGLLMASYDEEMGTIESEQVVGIGWTINGLVDLLLQIKGVREHIDDAVPVGSHAEA